MVRWQSCLYMIRANEIKTREHLLWVVDALYDSKFKRFLLVTDRDIVPFSIFQVSHSEYVKPASNIDQGATLEFAE